MMIDTKEVKKMCDVYIKNHSESGDNLFSQGVVIAMDSFKSIIELKEEMEVKEAKCAI